MIDLPLMARLLEALPFDTRIVLLGDSDQLASVEAGAVLSDICAGSSHGSLLVDNRPAIIKLTKSYRFTNQSGIGRLSHLINAGEGEAALALLKSNTHSDLCWRPLPPEAAFAALLKEAAVEGYGPFARAASPEAALEALERFRILAPHREGKQGIGAINRLVESALFSYGKSEWAEHSLLPVMVTGNNYDLGLYNGDTGVVVAAKTGEGQAVFFRRWIPGSGAIR